VCHASTNKMMTHVTLTKNIYINILKIQIYKNLKNKKNIF